MPPFKVTSSPIHRGPESVEREALAGRIADRHAQVKAQILATYERNDAASLGQWETRRRDPASIEHEIDALLHEPMRGHQLALAERIQASSDSARYPDEVRALAADVKAYRSYQRLASHAISGMSARVAMSLAGGAGWRTRTRGRRADAAEAPFQPETLDVARSRRLLVAGWLGQVAALPVSAPIYALEYGLGVVQPSYGSKSFLRAWKDVTSFSDDPACLRATR